MPKIKIDQAFIYKGIIYLPGEQDVPDEMAISLGKMPLEKSKSKRVSEDATSNPQA